MKIVFRADGNSEIGLGHVVRLLAIADMLSDDYQKSFIIRNPDSAIKEMIALSCNEIISLDKNSDYQDEAEHITSQFLDPDDILVLDGYHFGTAYQQTIATNGNQIVLISDFPDDKIVADVVINHAGGMKVEHYNSTSYSKFYLGAEYAIIRSPFLKEYTPKGDGIDKILVCFGGADPNNLTFKVVQALGELRNAPDTIVIVGSAYLHIEALDEMKRMGITIKQNLSASAMCGTIEESDLVICSSSSIAYEVCCLRRNMITGISADNQCNLHTFLTKEGLAYEVGDFYSITVGELAKSFQKAFDNSNWSKQIESQKRLFDHKSPQRIDAIFHKLNLINQIQIREANPDDAMLLYEWVNEPESRKMAINPEPVQLEGHISWFNKVLADNDRHLFMLHFENEPVGQIRFDKNENHYILSYSLDINYRGMGLGEVVIRKGIKLLTRKIGADPVIYAVVKADNVKSNKIFEKNHFVLKENKTIDGSDFCVYFRP